MIRAAAVVLHSGVLCGLAAFSADASVACTDQDTDACSAVNGNQLLQAKTIFSKANHSNNKGCKEVGQGCSVFKKCCKPALNCQPGVQKCYNVPRLLEQPCSAGFGCDDGLNCQPGVQKCYNVPRQEGQPCSAGFACGDGLFCKAGTHKCVSNEERFDPCGQGFDPNSESCGCFQPTCLGSRLCTCMLLPSITANCGAAYPCPARVDIDAGLAGYSVTEGYAIAGSTLKDVLACCPDGKLSYTSSLEQGLERCANECRKSYRCAAFVHDPEEGWCLFKSNGGPKGPSSGNTYERIYMPSGPAIDNYQKISDKKVMQKDLTNTLSCCPNGKITYTSDPAVCADECDTSVSCRGFVANRGSSQCTFKSAYGDDDLADDGNKDLYEKP